MNLIVLLTCLSLHTAKLREISTPLQGLWEKDLAGPTYVGVNPDYFGTPCGFFTGCEKSGLIVLMLLFGGGGFYLGGPMVGGGGFGLILLIGLVLFFSGGLSRR